MEEKMSNGEEYYRIAEEQIKRQLENVDALNAKVNTLLVVCSVLIVFFGELTSRGFFLAGLGLPFIVIALIFLLIAYTIIDWNQGPNIERVFVEMQEKTNLHDFYLSAIEGLVDIFKQNEVLIEKKTKRINKARKFIGFGVIITTLGMIIYLFLLVYSRVVLKV